MIWRLFSLLAKRLEKLNAAPVCFRQGNLSFVYFGVFCGLGAFLGLLAGFFYLSLRGYTLSRSEAALFLLFPLFIWLFARLGHFFALGKKFFLNPKKYLLETGLYNQGGILGAIVFAFLICSLTPILFAPLLDAVAYGGAIGLAVGRLGCYNYGCCWGSPAPDKVGIRYFHPECKVLRRRPEFTGRPLYPVQLLMSVYNALLFILCSGIAWLGFADGVLGATFILLHQGFRVWLEQYRDDHNFQEGRNKKTVYIAALFVFAVACILLLDQAGWLHFVGPDGAREKLSSSLKPYFWEVAAGSGLFLMLIYGVHGKRLGSW